MLLITPSGEYPRHIGDLWLEHPDYKEGDPLPDGWQLVKPVDRPVPDTYEIVYEDSPIEVDGQLVQNWQIRPMTDAEKAKKDAPATARQKLLDLGLTEVEIEALVEGLV